MGALARAVDRRPVEVEKPELRAVYLESLKLIERLHRRLLDVIKDEFDRKGRSDINSVQALLLYNIGDGELTASELRKRGYYLGSNVSYNVKKLVENGYLVQTRSSHDQRKTMVSLSPKALDLTARINDLYRRNAEELGRHFPDLGPFADKIAGSTDMANISLALPTIHPMLGLGTFPVSNHQPEFAAFCATETADKALLDGAIALAWTGIDAAVDQAVRTALVSARNSRRGAVDAPARAGS